MGKENEERLAKILQRSQTSSDKPKNPKRTTLNQKTFLSRIKDLVPSGEFQDPLPKPKPRPPKSEHWNDFSKKHSPKKPDGRGR